MKNSTRFVGLDLGDKCSDAYFADASGNCVGRSKVRTTKAGIRKAFEGAEPVTVALEVGTHSPWVSRLLEELGHDVVVANPRNVHLISRSHTKNDRKDAELLARLVRVDRELLSPVVHRSEADSQALLTVKSRAVLVRTRTMLMNHVRSVLKSQGESLPTCSSATFSKRARKEIRQELLLVLEGVLQSIETVTAQIARLDKEIAALEERYSETKTFRSVPGVGPVTAVTYRLVVQSPTRFRRARVVGSYLGLRPRQDQSGGTDKQLRITKAGDPYLRSLLVGCAQYILSRHGPDTDLRRWGLSLAERGGKNGRKRAVVAVARKLSVLLMALWRSGETYVPLQSENRQEAA